MKRRYRVYYRRTSSGAAEGESRHTSKKAAMRAAMALRSGLVRRSGGSVVVMLSTTDRIDDHLVDTSERIIWMWREGSIGGYRAV